MKYQQLMTVEFNNCDPALYNVTSDSEVTFDRVVEYFDSTEGQDLSHYIHFVDSVKDAEQGLGMTFNDEPIEFDLDNID